MSGFGQRRNGAALRMGPVGTNQGRRPLLQLFMNAPAAGGRGCGSESMGDEPTMVRNLRILVVDDAPHVLEMLVEYLRGEGFEVLGVADGEEALRRLPQFRPHLVLLDLLLPGLSGLETLQRIRALRRETGVVVVSGTEDVEIARRAVALGAVEYVTKPIDFTYLDSVLEIHTLMDQMDP